MAQRVPIGAWYHFSLDLGASAAVGGLRHAAERLARWAASAGAREACRSFISPVSRSNVRTERISAWYWYALGSPSTTARRRHSIVADAGRVGPAPSESKARSQSQPRQSCGVLPFPLIIVNRAFA